MSLKNDLSKSARVAIQTCGELAIWFDDIYSNNQSIKAREWGNYMRHRLEPIYGVNANKAVSVCDICDEVESELSTYMMSAFWFSNATAHFVDLTAEEIASLACDGYEVNGGERWINH